MVEYRSGRVSGVLLWLLGTPVIAESRPQATVGRPPGPTSSLRGRCVADESGEPLAGCTARLRAGQPWRSKELARTLEVTPPAVTGTDGGFELRFRLPDQSPHTAYLELEVTAAGRVPRTSRWYAQGWGGGGLDVGEVRLPRGFPVRGRTVDADGAPVPGLRISVTDLPLPVLPRAEGLGAESSIEGVTREDGSFLIEGVPPGEWPLSVAGSGARVLRPYQVKAGEGAAEIVVLVERLVVSGVVTDEEDRPVEGVSIRMSGSPYGGVPPGTDASLVRTGEDGSFTIFATEAQAGPAWLQCADPGPCEGFEPRRVGWGSSTRLRVRRTLEVDLEVVEGGSGRPVVEFEVLCHPDRPWPMFPWSLKERRFPGRHEGGRAKVDRVWRGRNLLRVFPSDSRLLPSDRVEFDVPEQGPAPALRVEVHPSVPLVVEVRRKDGSPIEGASVHLVDVPDAPSYSLIVTDPVRRSLPEPTTPYAFASARTDEHGRAILREGRAGDKCALLVSPPGEGQVAIRNFEVRDGISPVSIVAPGTRVRGRLSPPGLLSMWPALSFRRLGASRLTVRRVPQWETRGTCGNPDQAPWAKFDAETGEFLAAHLEPGEWEVSVSFSGSGDALFSLGTIRVVEGETIELALDGSRFAPATLEGFVLVDGRPAAGGGIELEARRPEGRRYLPAGKADSGGRFVASALVPGEYRLVVVTDVPGRPNVTRMDLGEWFSLGPGESAKKTFSLERR